MAVRLPYNIFGWETPRKPRENNPHLGANLGGLFLFIQVSKQREQKHAEHDHF